MVFKILLFNTEEDAWVKSQEYYHSIYSGSTKYRWAVEKHPTLEKWGVLIGEDIADLSQEDLDNLVDMWEIQEESLY